MPRYEDDDDDRPRRRRRYDEDEDDDRPSRSRRRSYDEDDEDRPRRRRKKQPKQMSTLGAIALGIAVLALLVSFMPCFASISLIPSGIAMVVGFIALVVAQKSDGRQGYGLPIAAMSVAAVAVLIGVGWLILGKQIEKKFDKDWKEAEAEMAKEEAQRKTELAKASKEVQAAGPDAVIQISAVDLVRAFQRNDRRATNQYSGKVLEVTGWIQSVDLDDEEETYSVILDGGPEDTVDCEFIKDPAIRARLAQLQPGQTVTIRGKCPGSTILEACILVN